MKVLIIDDEQAVLDMYRDKLQAAGFEVLTAIDGNKGLETTKSQKPDLILLDIIMPKFNGLDVLANLKKDKETAHVPVFLLTNLPEEMSGDKARQLGASGYLVKAEYEPAMLVNFLKTAAATKTQGILPEKQPPRIK